MKAMEVSLGIDDIGPGAFLITDSVPTYVEG
jgi:hypothetical protein